MSQDQKGALRLVEIREFASFSRGAQRYIRIALDAANDDPMIMDKWSRDVGETAVISAQRAIYRELPAIKAQIPSTSDLDQVDPFLGSLIRLSTFDLLQGKLVSFPEYRFLYERLLGSSVRKWLPSSFCASSAMPNIDPKARKDLLQSISEAAATAPGWSSREPLFFPEWVEKVDLRL
jgi:hypothetical protein